MAEENIITDKIVKELKKRSDELVIPTQKVAERIILISELLEKENYPHKTRKGKTIVELSNMHEDLNKKDVEINVFFTTKLEKEYIPKLEDPETIKMLQELSKQLPNPAETIWLNETVKEIETERGNNYQHLIEKYDGYVTALRSWNDNETARRLEKISRYVKDEEGAHIEKLRTQIEQLRDAIKNKNFVIDVEKFHNEIDAYIEYMKKDAKVVKEIENAAVIKLVRNFNRAKTIIEGIAKRTSNSIQTKDWTEYKEIFGKKSGGKIKTYTKMLKKLGDMPSVRLLEGIRKVKWGEAKRPESLKWFKLQKEGIISPDEIVKVLTIWSERMKSGEYLKTVEQKALEEADVIITKREQELSKIRARNIQVLTDILKHRIKKLEATKETISKEATNHIDKRKKELLRDWAETRNEFQRNAARLVNLINEYNTDKNDKIIEESSQSYNQNYTSLEQKMKEKEEMLKQLLSIPEKMKKPAQANMQELVRICKEMFQKSKEIIDLEEQIIAPRDTLMKDITTKIRLMEQIVKIYEDESKKIDETEQRMSIIKETGTAEIHAGEMPEFK